MKMVSGSGFILVGSFVWARDWVSAISVSSFWSAFWLVIGFCVLFTPLVCAGMSVGGDTRSQRACVGCMLAGYCIKLVWGS